MLFLSILNPHSLLTPFWHAPYVLGFGGLFLVSLSIFLRQAESATCTNNDWLNLKELSCLIAFALAVVAADIYYSQKLGLLAFPPYYDGIAYMCAAKYAILSLPSWMQHPMRAALFMFGNHYPLWKILLFVNFKVFGIGEWQSYAVRFWPTLIILSTIFWVSRRRAGSLVAWAAVFFTALLPTLSLNFLSAALGHPIYPHGYLADLRPDLLFAAFIMLFVGVMVEHANNFDQSTSLIAGISAALAILTKATAISLVVLSFGICVAFVLFVNRTNIRRTVVTMLWALLPLTVLLLPWLLAGGLENTFVYVKRALKLELPHYSNAHPTLRTEFTYYWFWLVKHMGWATVVLTGASPLLLWLSNKTKNTERPPVYLQFIYLIIAIALYCLVSLIPPKNYFVGLPCYLTLWIFCVGSVSLLIASFQPSRAAWGLFLIAITTVCFIGIGAVNGLRTWQGHEFEEGRQDRIALQQIAKDLRQLLSNQQSFISMSAYGAPGTILFYMPDREGAFPQGILVFRTGELTISEFLQKTVEPAKAVLILSNGNKSKGLTEVGWYGPLEVPYYRATEDWVKRPGSSHHLSKTYDLYGNASVELYVRN